MCKTSVIASGIAAAAALLLGLGTTGSWASEERNCNLRGGYFQTDASRQFTGMFQIVLDPPHLGDFAAVQRHAALTRIWGGVISDEIRGKSHGLCTALATSLGFPDLRIFLAVNRTGSQIDREKGICLQVLQDVVKRLEPGEAVIKDSIRRYMAFASPTPPSPWEAAVSPAVDANNVSLIAMRRIYEEGSPLYTLVTAEASKFAADVESLRAWIRTRRQSPRFLLESIPHCLQPGGDLSKSANIPAERLESSILPPGEFSLSRSPAGPLPPGPLRYVVMIGDPSQPPGLVVQGEVDRKYCYQARTFSLGEESSEHRTMSVQLRCSTRGLGDLDAWTYIYCHPKDCSSEPVERAVMSAVAADPEILDFARRSSTTATPRGPYLITIK